MVFNDVIPHYAASFRGGDANWLSSSLVTVNDNGNEEIETQIPKNDRSPVLNFLKMGLRGLTELQRDVDSRSYSSMFDCY